MAAGGVLMCVLVFGLMFALMCVFDVFMQRHFGAVAIGGCIGTPVTSG